MLYLRVLIGAIAEAFSLVLVVYCVSTWFIRDNSNKFMQLLQTIVYPVLEPVRNLLSKVPFLNSLPVDFSPIVVFLLCEFITTLV